MKEYLKKVAPGCYLMCSILFVIFGGVDISNHRWLWSAVDIFLVWFFWRSSRD